MELMDGHVILMRHGLRVAVRCAVGEGEREGALRAPSLYIESVQWIQRNCFYYCTGRPDQRHLLVEPWLRSFVPPENLFERQLWKVLRPRHVGRESDDDQTRRDARITSP